jgi:GNAT superfamily N-acetyltransferase
LSEQILRVPPLGKEMAGTGTPLTNHSHTPIRLVPLSWLNVWAAWRVAKGVFAHHPTSILSCFVASLLPRALWPADIHVTMDKVNYYVATKEGKVAGFTGLYTLIDQPGEIWVGWYGLDEKMRGHGIGKEILRSTVDMARMDGYETLRLWTTGKSCLTAAARSLYDELGFVSETTGVEYYGYPVLIYNFALKGGQPSPYRGSMRKALAGADLKKVQPKLI